MGTEEIKISCLGDIAPLNQTCDELLNNKDKYKRYFEDIFHSKDIVFGNLETAITNNSDIRENKKYVFKTSSEVLDIFPNNFIYSLANNHILDYGDDGLTQTISNLKAKQIKFSGAGANLDEAGKPVVVEIKNTKIGFIAAADTRYQIASETKAGIYPAKPELLSSNISDLSTQVDIIYVSIHMGMEFISAPTPVMRHLSKVCITAGADVVFFHHAHCVSGFSKNDQNATLWGTGNFIFNTDMKFKFNRYFETASWNIIHSQDTKNLKLEIKPFRLNKFGIPEPTNQKLSNKIITRINKLSSRIDNNKSLWFVRLKDIFTLGYIKIVIINYTDIAKRQGIRTMFRVVFSAIRSLFINKM